MDRPGRYTQKEQAVTEMKEKLQKLGMYEEDMTKSEMTDMLSAFNASVDSADKYNDFKDILEESVLKSQELDQVREDLYEAIDKVEKQISPTKTEESDSSKTDISLDQSKNANRFFKSTKRGPPDSSIANWTDCKKREIVNETKKNKKLNTQKKPKNMGIGKQTNEENCLMKNNTSVTPVKCETGKSPRDLSTKQKRLNETQYGNRDINNVSQSKSVDKKMTENFSEFSDNRVDEKKHFVTSLEKKRRKTLFREKYDLKCPLNEQPFFLVENSKAKMLSIDVQARLINLFLNRQVQRIAQYQKSLKPSGTRFGKPVVTSENSNGCLERNPFKPPEEESDSQNDADDKEKSDSDDDFVTKQTPKEEKIRNTRKRLKTNDEIIATSKLFADIPSLTSDKNQTIDKYSEISLIIRGDDTKKEKKMNVSDLMTHLRVESSADKDKVFKTRSDAIFDALKNKSPSETPINIEMDKSDSDTDLGHEFDYIPEGTGRRVVPPIPNKPKSNPVRRNYKKQNKQLKITMQQNDQYNATDAEKETEQCPICNHMFSASKIQGHASYCRTEENDYDIAVGGLRPLKRRNLHITTQQDTKRNKQDE